jgi:hypothetical protein
LTSAWSTSSVGDDWESMTPLTRADEIAAEADEMPLEAPVAPLAS